MISTPHLFICLLLSSILRALAADINNIARPGCPTKCGNVDIPYPFGIGSGCSMNSWFNIQCNDSTNPPIMTLSDYTVLNISESEIEIKTPSIAYRCRQDNDIINENILTVDFSGSPFSLSDANQITILGCSDMVTVEAGFSRQHASANLTSTNIAFGCVGFCSDGQQSLNVSCPGNGCHQFMVRKGAVFVNASYQNFDDPLRNNRTFRPVPCSSFILGSNTSLTVLDAPDLYKLSIGTILDWKDRTSLVLDWRIGNESCREVAVWDSSGFACLENSFCVDVDADIGGYRCVCSDGFEGNPYLPPGCQDIDECKINPHPCRSSEKCVNYPGGFNCEVSTSPTKLILGLSTGKSILVALLISLGFGKFLRKRRNKKRKEKFFKQNGGLLLKQQTSANTGLIGNTRIFTAKELEKATDRFNESRILGRGGQGIVYKGMLSDGQIVAIKKSQLVDEHKSTSVVEQFINEVVILSQINHKNVVKLFGCCLETKVPYLVYEFVPNGTLSNHIHNGGNSEFPICWTMRLKIAVEVAGALAYLHSATSLPIFHGDIKSTNILLDEKYVAKVSDFGTSTAVAADQTHLTTKVKGTFGYIDPEYFHTSKFTDKSDVYSFGVVLVELLTGLKPIIYRRDTDDEIGLVSHFLSSMNENNLDTILESQVAKQGDKEEIIAVANLARRCLNLNGLKRPSMKEVAVELESVRMSNMRSSDDTPPEEDSLFYRTESLKLDLMDYKHGWTTSEV